MTFQGFFFSFSMVCLQMQYNDCAHAVLLRFHGSLTERRGNVKGEKADPGSRDPDGS
jgi:hypothetical protein